MNNLIHKIKARFKFSDPDASPSTKLSNASFNIGLETSIELIEKHDRWIPITERLPDIESNGFSKLVLVRNISGNIRTDRFDKEFQKFCGLHFTPISWRDIPE